MVARQVALSVKCRTLDVEVRRSKRALAQPEWDAKSLDDQDLENPH